MEEIARKRKQLAEEESAIVAAQDVVVDAALNRWRNKLGMARPPRLSADGYVFELAIEPLRYTSNELHGGYRGQLVLSQWEPNAEPDPTGLVRPWSAARYRTAMAGEAFRVKSSFLDDLLPLNEDVPLLRALGIAYTITRNLDSSQIVALDELAQRLREEIATAKYGLSTGSKEVVKEPGWTLEKVRNTIQEWRQHEELRHDSALDYLEELETELSQPDAPYISVRKEKFARRENGILNPGLQKVLCEMRGFCADKRAV